MKSLVGKKLLTIKGEEVTVLKRRKSRTFPFFKTFYLYDILWRGLTLSIRCKEINNLVNGESVNFIFD
jgi:hypothetical protein